MDIKERTAQVIQKTPFQRQLQSESWAIKDVSRQYFSPSCLCLLHWLSTIFSLCFFCLCIFFKKNQSISFFHFHPINLFEYRLSFSLALFSPFLWLRHRQRTRVGHCLQAPLAKQGPSGQHTPQARQGLRSKSATAASPQLLPVANTVELAHP